MEQATFSAAVRKTATRLLLAAACLVAVASLCGREAGADTTARRVVAWGDNTYYQIEVPAGLSGVQDIAAGTGHNLALNGNGSVVLWGLNAYGMDEIPAGLSGVQDIAAGFTHSLALNGDGSVVAWGFNGYGQINVPDVAKGGVQDIAAGHSHSLALKEDGSVVAWGWNDFGQSDVPRDLTGVKISAGGFHNLALKEDGSVVAWGDNDYGQIDVPDAAKGGVQDIAAGLYHSLALKEDGSVVAWGRNDYGQSDPPRDLTGVKEISAGYFHNLALKGDGSVVAWGSNDEGQSDVPAGLSSVRTIAAGGSHSLVLEGAPPAPVELFGAEAGEGRAALSWFDPDDAEFAFTRVLRSTTSIAASPTPDADQTQIYEGVGEGFLDTGLDNGTTYYYTAFAGDGFGNWSVRAVAKATPGDTTAPETAITSAPEKTSKGSSATFQFTSTEPDNATFECSLDDAPFEGCAPGKTYEDLEDDFHIFEVRATDAAGNVDPSPARRVWTVDTFSPRVTDARPSGSRVLPTVNVTATFSEAMNESAVEAAGVMTLRKRSGAPLPATVDYDPGARKVTLNPNASLKRGATYAAILTGGATDRAGNPLRKARWTFTIKE